MQTGKIVRIVEQRGFGFIRPADSSPEVFFHFRVLKDLDFDGQLIQREVEFTSETDPKGRGLRAQVVQPIGGVQ